MCRLQATLDPKTAWQWCARADRWESLAEAAIQIRFRECNLSRAELAA
jgi:hypothetical protein